MTDIQIERVARIIMLYSLAQYCLSADNPPENERAMIDARPLPTEGEAGRPAQPEGEGHE